MKHFAAASEPYPDLPCCNLIEQEDLTAILCPGTMSPSYPTYDCDTCGAHCGVFAHPGCAPARQAQERYIRDAMERGRD